MANMSGFIKAFLKLDIKLLLEKGYEVSCAANDNIIFGEKDGELLRKMGVKFYQIDFDSKRPLCYQNYIAYKQIKELVNKEKFDVIFSHTPIVGAITRIVGKKYRKKGMKLIYMTHGLPCTKYSSKKEWLIYFNLEKYLSKFTDLIITINHDDYKLIKQKMRCKNVEYIPGVGFDFNKYNNVKIDRIKYRKSIGVNENDFMILSVGEISKRKNHRVIIEALAKINDKNNIFVIAGRDLNNNILKNELISLAKEKNVRIKFLGFRTDIPELIHCSDVGVMPSIREGLGMAGVQMLAGGVPIIGSSIQGINDYVIDEKTGYVCSPFDINGFKNNIEKIKTKLGIIEFKENCIEISKKFTIEESEKARNEIFEKYF